MISHSLRTRLGVLIALAALLAFPLTAGVSADNSQSANANLKHVFVIMLENHSKSSVIGNANAPFISSLASTYGLAANYYGVTHPSLPNYVAAISGSNWFVNDDQPTNTFNHTNLVDQLESRGKSWAAYMETMPSVGYTGAQYPANAALYVNKHNPFVLFDDIRSNPERLSRIKPYTSFAADMNSGRVPDFVWISPNQCHDMHGGVYTTVARRERGRRAVSVRKCQGRSQRRRTQGQGRRLRADGGDDHHVLQGLDREQRDLHRDR